MEGDQPTQGESVQSQTPASSSKKPEKALYVPKNRQGATVQGGPKDKPQTQGDAKPRPRPRYTDKARKNAKNKKDKAGRGGEVDGAPKGDSQSEERLLGGEGPQDDGLPPAANEGEDVEGGSRLETTHHGNGVPAEGEEEDQQEEEEEEEDSWDTLFNDEGECLDPHVVEELARKAGKKKRPVQERRFDYYGEGEGEGEEEGDVDLREDELAHILEIYDFPSEFKTEDLLKSFQSYQQRGFDIQWVDDSHALGLFSSPIAAREALRTTHPLMKVRPLSKSSVTTRAKARSCSDYLLPSKERPPTSAALARRMVIGALGVKSNQSQEDRQAERRKLQEAKDQKRLASKQREDAWEGR